MRPDVAKWDLAFNENTELCQISKDESVVFAANMSPKMLGWDCRPVLFLRPAELQYCIFQDCETKRDARFWLAGGVILGQPTVTTLTVSAPPPGLPAVSLGIAPQPQPGKLQRWRFIREVACGGTCSWPLEINWKDLPAVLCKKSHVGKHGGKPASDKISNFMEGKKLGCL